MFVGQLDQRIETLDYVQQDGRYAWKKKKAIWSHVEQDQKINIFSGYAKAGTTTLFTVREQEIGMRNVISYQGKYYLITGLKKLDRMYAQAQTAKLPVYDCQYTNYNPDNIILDNYNRPTNTNPTVIRFQGMLAEKYLGSQVEKPQTIGEIRYILLVPKVITLEQNDIVTISEEEYAVEACHVLDEYKNEYEIVSRKDV